VPVEPGFVGDRAAAERPSPASTRSDPCGRRASVRPTTSRATAR
jgi:hypothetical protein